VSEHHDASKPRPSVEETRARVAHTWSRGRALLEQLGTSGVLQAVEPVLETLEHFLGFPDLVPAREVLALFLSVTRSAVAHGYAARWSSIEVVERVLRRVLADRTELLNEPKDVALIGEILDGFLDAGVYKAILLARDLDLGAR